MGAAAGRGGRRGAWRAVLGVGVAAALGFSGLGCGLTQTIIVIAAIASQDGGAADPVTLPSPPAAVVAPLARTVGAVPVAFTLLDANADPCDVVVEYAIDGGALFFAASADAASEGTSGLSSAPGGEGHVFVWDAPRDLGAGAFPSVVVRVTPRDASGAGAAGRSPGTALLGNDPPAVLVEALTVAEDPARAPTVRLRVVDSTRDPVDLEVEVAIFASDDALGATPLATATATILSGDTDRLASDPEGLARSFTWNMTPDLGAFERARARLRIRPRDVPVGAWGARVETAIVEWTGGNAPTAVLEPVPRAPGVEAALTLTLIAPRETAGVDLEAAFSVRDPVTGAFSEPLPCTFTTAATGLTASLLGTRRTLVWRGADFLAGLPGESALVRLHVRPIDRALVPEAVGPTATSLPFRIGNRAPSLALGSAAGAGGIVPIVFTAVDPDGDALTVALETSQDGVAYRAAGAGTVLGLGGALGASEAGLSHGITYLAAGDLGLGTFTGLRIRLTPRDTGPGAATETAVSSLTITDAPALLVMGPPAGAVLGREARIDALLVQALGEAADVAASVRVGSLAGTPALEVATGAPLGGRFPTSPTGAALSLAWDVAASITRDAQEVRLDLAPASASGSRGATVTAGPYVVNVNAEPSVLSVTVEAPDGRGVFPVTARVVDAEGDETTLRGRVSLDGGATFHDAPSLAVTVTALPTATAVALVWNAGADLPALGITGAALRTGPTVVLEITPRDDPAPALGDGRPGRSAPFAIDLTTPPVITDVASPQGAVQGVVVVPFTLSDAEGDAAIVDVAYSLDRGATYASARPLSPTAALPPGPAAFAWSSFADLPLGAPTVTLRLSPRDSKAGVPVETAAFEVRDQFTPPPVRALAVTPVAGVLSGDVDIPFRVEASEGDDLTVAVAFEVPGVASGTASGAFEDAQGSPVDLSRFGVPLRTDLRFRWASATDAPLLLTPLARLTFTLALRSGGPALDARAVALSLDNRPLGALVIGQASGAVGAVSGAGLHLSGPPGPRAATPTGIALEMRTPPGFPPRARLAIPDPLHHRALVWLAIDAAGGRAADLAIGQPDLASHAPPPESPPASRSALRAPVACAFAPIGDGLAIADPGEGRVVVLDMDAAGARLERAAFAVSGAAPFSPVSLSWSLFPGGADQLLFVLDAANRRVLALFETDFAAPPGATGTALLADTFTIPAPGLAMTDPRALCVASLGADAGGSFTVLVSDPGGAASAIHAIGGFLSGAPTTTSVLLEDVDGLRVRPLGLASVEDPRMGHLLLVADRGDALADEPSRVLVYRLAFDPNGMALPGVRPLAALPGVVGATGLGAGGGGADPGIVAVLEADAHRARLKALPLSARSRIVIDEVHPAEQWVELRNLGPAPASLEGYAVTRQGGAPAHAFTPQDAPVLAVGGRVVLLAGTAPTGFPPGTSVVEGIGAALALDASGDDVVLRLGATPVDYAAYGFGAARQNPPSGVAWTGAESAQPGPLESLSRGAFGDGVDTDQAIDFAAAVPSPGAVSAGVDPAAPVAPCDALEGVLGQPRQDASGALARPVTEENLLMPSAAVAFPALPSGRGLALLDTARHRALLYDRVPERSGEAADRVFGQLDFGSGAPGSGIERLSRPEGIDFDADPAERQLFIADTGNGVIMRYPLDGETGEAGTILAFHDLSGAPEPPFAEACAVKALRVAPGGPFLLFVVERGDATRPGALRVYRQALPDPVRFDAIAVKTDARLCAGALPVAALDAPSDVLLVRDDVALDRVGIFLADTGNDRVLCAIADLSLAGSDLGLGAASPTLTAALVLGDDGLPETPAAALAPGARLRSPAGLALVDGRLVVADAGANRLLVFPLAGALSSGAAAQAAIGQPDKASRAPNALGLDGRALFLEGAAGPAARIGIGVALSPGGLPRLLVPDPGNARVVGLDLELPAGPGVVLPEGCAP